MVEKDTIRLLRECDAGIKMGISSIDTVLSRVKSEKMEQILKDCREAHLLLAKDMEKALERFGDEGKDPNPMTKSMSWIKTEMMMAMKEGDDTISDLMTDGCNMGVKSLSRYLNEYKAADEVSKDICKKLIALEEKLAVDLRPYL